MSLRSGDRGENKEIAEDPGPYMLEAAMEQWEHLVLTLKADAKKQKDFLQSNWPGEFFPIYAPEALIPELDAIGRQGWELVSAQPVIIGANGDVTYAQPTTSSKWTHEYLCFFKRRKQVG